MPLFGRRKRHEPEKRDILDYSFGQWVQDYMQWGAFAGLNQTIAGNEEQIPPGFEGYVSQAYKSNGVVFACMLTHQLVFSEARFAFRELTDGRPGKLHAGGDGRNPGFRDLELLRTPWPNGTTGDLLTRAIQDADLAGNFFCVRTGRQLFRLRPDWVTIVLGADAREYDVAAVGYLYHPGGRAAGQEPTVFDVDQVAHFAPIPDPTAPYRGMSWLTPVLREIQADSSATTHKQKFFDNGATVNLIVQTGIPPANKDQFFEWTELWREKHQGMRNAYKTLMLAAGQDATPVGANLEEADFANVQGKGETRIAAAAGVPPVIVGLSEGLQAATYSNYAQARRRFADGWARPMWRNFAGSMAKLIAVPAGSELWYDDRDVAFLREDQKDAAEISQIQATTIKTLTDAGFDPDQVLEAVVSGDPLKLKGQHSGLFSVQLQPPNTDGKPSDANKAGRALAELVAPHLKELEP